MAASRKLEHELGIPQSQTPVDEFQYLTRIQYLAPSNGLWGEHEGELSTLLSQAVARCRYDNALTINWNTVDYILFFTGNVDVTPNLNEISDYKYVSRTELQQMFEDPGMFIPSRFLSLGPFSNDACITAANSFTPWFKLIARDFLFGWWDELLAPSRLTSEGRCVAKSLNGIVDGNKIFKMV